MEVTLLPRGGAATLCLRCHLPFRYVPARDGAGPPFCPSCAARPAETHPRWHRRPYCAGSAPADPIAAEVKRADELKRRLRAEGVRSAALLRRPA